ncbi:MAG: helix-turn-helix transcriptional regulator [Prolixibacteraceae bacterium]
MGTESFGNYIRRLRMEKNLPLRKVAAQLDIDTSTLSKVERGDRPISIKYLKPLSQILEIDLKEIQIKFLADAINREYGQLEFFVYGLKEAEDQYLTSKKNK